MNSHLLNDIYIGVLSVITKRKVASVINLCICLSSFSVNSQAATGTNSHVNTKSFYFNCNKYSRPVVSIPAAGNESHFIRLTAARPAVRGLRQP
jgi:hypothetical protein